ncbi:MAG: hypothetical protein WBA93_30910 [Microcoleaceae cyanobacterium]
MKGIHLFGLSMILFLIGLSFVTFQERKNTYAQSISSPNSSDIKSLVFQFTTETHTFQPGDLGKVRLTLTNQGSSKICLPASKLKDYNQFPAVTLSLVASNEALPPLQQVNSDKISLLILEPQQQITVPIELNTWFGELLADTYTLFAKYKPPSTSELPNYFEEAKAQGCQLWLQAIRSDHFTFIIQAEQSTIERYAYQYRTETLSSQDRLSALLWLRHNVLVSGMMSSEVYSLLGEPTEQRENNWIFRVGQVGIGIEWEERSISRIYDIEY